MTNIIKYDEIEGVWFEMKERERAELVLSIVGAIISATVTGVYLNDYGTGIIGIIIYIIMRW